MRQTADIRQVLMDGGIELMGPEEAGIVFAQPAGHSTSRDGDAAALLRVHTGLKKRYGERGGRGVALRLGRAAFQYGLRCWGEAAGITTSAFRLQPSPRKVRAVLNLLAEQLNGRFSSSVRLNQDDLYWYWSVEACPVCAGRSTEAPDCHLMVGVLMELLSWAGSGRYFRVEEIECAAAGAPACLFRIEKKAMD